MERRHFESFGHRVLKGVVQNLNKKGRRPLLPSSCKRVRLNPLIRWTLAGAEGV